MKLMTVNISIPDKIANHLASEGKINYLRDNVQEYIEQAIEDLSYCVHWDKKLKVTFE